MLEDKVLEKFYLEADLSIIDNPYEDGLLKAMAADTSFSLPDKKEKQPDLLYNRSILVSTGKNKNGAYFIPAELFKARSTIVNKAMDMEHDEQHVVGHILDYAFLQQDSDGSSLYDVESKYKESASEEDFNKKEVFDIGIISVVHELRFPEIASEIREGKYGVSMETLYRTFDVLVGNVAVPKEQAISSGLIKMVGRSVRIVHNNLQIFKEDASTDILKRFYGMHFSGCGFVKKPANPRSLVLESASEREENSKMAVKEFDVKGIPAFDKYVQEQDRIEIYTKSNEKASQESVKTEEPTVKEEHADVDRGIESDAGQCVSFKRYVYDPANPHEAGAEIIHENWCALFEEDCPVAGASTDPVCLRNVLNRTVLEVVKNKTEVLWQARDKRAMEDIERYIMEGPSDEMEPRVHSPGPPLESLDIEEIRREIDSNEVGVPIEELVRNSGSTIASVKESIDKANGLVKATRK